MARDYYEILGVSKSASQDEIKKAFRKLAHEHHPDKATGNEAKFKEINEAYQVIGDADKRAKYDQFGHAFNNQAGGGYNAGGFDFNDFASAFGGQQRGGSQNFNFEFGDLGDIFGGMFGGGQQRGGRQRRGNDVSVNLEIDFRDAVFGIEKTITLAKDETCEHCHGNKAEPGTKIVTCSTCKGTGQVTRQVAFGFGMAATCSACDGEGSVPEKKCKVCNGAGYTRGQKTMTVKIPAGIDNGQMIKLTGQGNAGPNGRNGDLYLQIQVREDKRFEREGFDVVSEQTISFPRATLGGTVEIETVDGLIKLKIPEGTQSHKLFRIKEHGIPHLQRNGRGDHIVRVIVETPTKLSRKQRKLMEELEEELE